MFYVIQCTLLGERAIVDGSQGLPRKLLSATAAHVGNLKSVL